MKKQPLLLRNGFSRMTLDDQIARARAVDRDRTKRLAAIKTRRQAEAYRDEAAAEIAKCFGVFPHKTPLNARVTGDIEHPAFVIEKVVFEGRPGFLVTANLYVPKNLRGPAPAVLGNCGHDRTGKAGAENQAYSQELAQCGYVVLTFDPIAQGERDQHLSLPAGHRLRTDCAFAHVILGQQLQLTGEFFGTWMVWDGMRALDYLLSRPEVDPRRVAVTGNSGGGCLSTLLWALEPRLKMAAPSCWVNSFLAVIENEVGGDAEQSPPGALGRGIEQSDFFLCRAPEPAILIAQKHDFFDRRRVAGASREVRRIYELFGARNYFTHFVGENTHGYFPDGRSAMRAFFARHFRVRNRTRLSVRPHTPKELFVLPHGEVLRNGSHSVREIHSRLSSGIPKRKNSRPASSLRAGIIDVLGLHDYRVTPVWHRNLRSDWLEGKMYGRHAVSTERGIETILRKVHVPSSGGLVQALSVERKVSLYVPHWSSEAEVREFPVARKLSMKPPLYTVDVRGIGESMCRDKADPEVHYWMDYLSQSFDALLGVCHLGRRVFDLMKTCDLLTQEGAREIRLIANGQGSLIAAFATVLHPRILSADLHNAPVSFAEWVRSETLAWPAAMCPRGVLKEFDLPDVYRTFRSKLRIRSRWNAVTCPIQSQ